MAFFAPLVVGALGLTGVAAGVAEIGLGLGLSFVAKKLRPKQKSSTASEARGTPVNLTIDTNPNRTVIIGEAATGGSLAYWQLSGTDNNVLHMVIPLADHECTSLEKVLVNGKEKTRNATTGEIDGYGANLVIRFYSGAAGQTADSEVVATSGGRWTANEVGTGVCYVVAKLTYDEKLFPEGIPDLSFVVRGLKLFDPRTSTTGYSANVAVALWNVLRGISSAGEPLLGMNVPSSAIRISDAQAAANACDEAMALKAGGTEPRYRCGFVFSTSQSNRDIIETLLAAMAGELIECGGIYRMIAGVSQTPVAALTDSDIIISERLVAKPKRSRNELTNAIQGSFTDPSRGHASVALPPRTSSADELADGGIRLSRAIDLSAVTSRAQAQRVLEVERKRARRMGSVSMRVRARHFVLEPGDWVTFTSGRRGYSSKTFVVHSCSGNRDLTSDIVLNEIDDGIDDWTASIDEIDDNQVIDLASAGPSLSAVSGFTLDAVTIASTGGIQRPGLHVTWTPIADPTVINLIVEFRKVGDTVALTTNPIQDPTDGTYTWVTGVQSGGTYEARIRPVTRPQRSTAWSSWVAASTASANQVVAVAAYAATVDPLGLPPATLSAQAAFELSLVTQTDDILGSISQQVKDLVEQANKAHIATINAALDTYDNRTKIEVEKNERITEDLSLAQLITTIQAQIGTEVIAAIQEEQTARATADTALSQDVSTALTRIGANEASVTVIAASINGMEAKFGVAVNANGHIIGLVQLDGSATAGSTFTVVADNFRVGRSNGTGVVPVFALQTVNGVTKMALRGDMLADGTITANKINVASLSALAADLGTVTAGLIRNPANTLRFDLPNMRLYRGDNTMELDFANKVFRMVF